MSSIKVKVTPEGDVVRVLPDGSEEIVLRRDNQDESRISSRSSRYIVPRLMLDKGFSASSAAFEVGYVSVSQFTREYGRLFQAPLKRDALRTRQNHPASKNRRSEFGPEDSLAFLDI